MVKKKTFREIRKVIRRKKSPKSIDEHFGVLFRFIHLQWFKACRSFVYFGFRLWLRRVHNAQYLPKNGPAIIVSNHLSYFDWGTLSAIYGNKHLVYIANKDILNRFFVGSLMWINIPIFIDPQKPGVTYLKKAIRCLKENRILVIYPEGTRSKSGKMLEPKTGFIKIGLRTQASIIPIGMKGTFETLPPHKIFPRLKKFDIIVGKPFKLSPEDPLFSDLFDCVNGELRVSEESEKIMAFRVMENIRQMTGQEWESKEEELMNV